jgi:hypothetical protein
MRLTRATTIALLAGLALVTASVPASADPILWNGPAITFTKLDFADPTLSINQDRLTSNVWLTRGSNRPLFNILVESGPTDFSPADTEWAFGRTQPGNPGPIRASNYANLLFNPFIPALHGAIGSNILDTPGVLHLISDDIYLDIEFTSWTSGGGGFSYTRSTPDQAPVPEPATATLLVVGAVAAMGARSRRAKRQGTVQGGAQAGESIHHAH